MRISVVVPVFNQEKDVIAFIESIEAKLKSYTERYDIIVTTNQDFDYVEKLHQRLPEYVDLVALKLTDDYQQVVMAGVDRAEGDATIIMTPEYEVDLIDTMIEDWKNGKQIVCLRRKHSKFGKFITRMRLRIYNLFLFLFGDIFSIGILKDAQLLDKEIVDKMRGEQDMAHRFRTMYAPLDYNTSVHDIDHPIEKFETKGTPQFDFWLGAIGALITLIAFITCIILSIALTAPIWVWTLFVIFWLIFEFLFIALLVNATARVKIGILHNVDANGKIYNVVQEYYASNSTKKDEETHIKTAKLKKKMNKAVEDIAIVEESEKSKPKRSTKKQEAKENIQENIVEKPSRDMTAVNLVNEGNAVVAKIEEKKTTKRPASKSKKVVQKVEQNEEGINYTPEEQSNILEQVKDEDTKIEQVEKIEKVTKKKSASKATTKKTSNKATSKAKTEQASKKTEGKTQTTSSSVKTNTTNTKDANKSSTKRTLKNFDEAQKGKQEENKPKTRKRSATRINKE